MKGRLLKHTSPTATRDSGSYEVKFPDGRQSAYFYWDDDPGPPLQNAVNQQRGSGAQGEGIGADRTGQVVRGRLDDPRFPHNYIYRLGMYFDLLDVA